MIFRRESVKGEQRKYKRTSCSFARLFTVEINTGEFDVLLRFFSVRSHVISATTSTFIGYIDHFAF